MGNDPRTTQEQIRKKLIISSVLFAVMLLSSATLEFISRDTANHSPVVMFSLALTLVAVVAHLRSLKQASATMFETLDRWHQENTELLSLANFRKQALDIAASVLLTDKEGVILEVNDAFEKISLWSREEALGKTPRILKSGRTELSVYKELWNTISSGKIWSGEICNCRRDGQLFWEDLTIVPKLDRSGKPINFMSVSFDITDRKRSEEALLARLQEEALVSSLFDLFLGHTERDFFELIEMSLRLLGTHFGSHTAALYQSNQNSGRLELESLWEKQQTGTDRTNLPRVVSPDLLAALDQVSDSSLRTLRISSGDSLSPDQKTIRNSFSLKESEKLWCAPLVPGDPNQGLFFMIDNNRDENTPQEKVRFLGVVIEVLQNIIARERVEFELRSIEEKLHTMANNAPVLLWMTNTRGERNFVNKRWQDYTSQVSESGTEVPYLEAIHPEDREAYELLLKEAQENKQGFTSEFRLRRFDGSYSWFLEQVTPRVTAHGTFLGFVGGCIDISDIKRLQGELETAHEEAVSAMRSKAEFLANMSHEIRTPMNAIIGMTQLLQGTRLDNEQTENLNVIVANSKFLLGVVNDILEFSKSEANHIELAPEPFSVRELVSQVAASLENQAREKAVTLDCDLSGVDADSLHGDRFRLMQVLVNLTNNALKFTHKGGVKLSATSTTKDARSARLRLEVTDTGIGIPADKIGRLFKPFSQVDASLNRRYGGTGLGLAIAARLIALMGGTIEVASVEGHGSTFWFEIELGQTSADDVIRTKSQESSIDHPQILSSEFATQFPLRILVAEDTAPNQKIIMSVLKKLGYSATLAENGEEALQKVKQEPFDLILMDVHMPVMDGFQATRCIRQQTSGDAVRPRIVAMTANAMRSDREACLQAGMDDYLAKPLIFGDLKQLLAKTSEKTMSKPVEKPTAPAPLDAANMEHNVIKRLELLHSEIGDKGIIAEIIQAFFSSTEPLVAELRRVVEVTDRKDLAGLAHALKGSGRNLGGVAFGDLAEELEHEAKEGTINRFSEKKEKLLRSYDALAECLKAQLRHYQS
jgi:PAS domain S-box-containing protein